MIVTRIALIGDYNPAVTAHQAIPRALELASRACELPLEWTWVATDTIQPQVSEQLASYDAIWCVPASPYASLDGALRAIRFARETGRPFLGTCGGFQHAVLEYARNVMGMSNADHAESNPDAALPLIAPLACALVEQSGWIGLEQGSRLAAIYGRAEIEESYHCSYGLNPQFEAELSSSQLRISGRDRNAEVRAVELTTHPFFIGTRFQPERAALKGSAHPLVNAFVLSAKAEVRATNELSVTKVRGSSS
jgi:CTP synthase (UTP-ammonia lyase)